VELLTATLFVACYASFGFTWLTLKSCIFCFLIVGLIFMDAETGLLPGEFTYWGIGIGLLLAWIIPGDSSGKSFLFNVLGLRGIPPGPKLSLVDAVVAAMVGAGFFYLAWALYYIVRKRHGLGLGDIALMAMVGAFLGLKLTVLVIFLAPIMATVFALTMLAIRGKSDKTFLSGEVPFGAFLGMNSLVALFLGEPIWTWYIGLFGRGSWGMP